MFFSLASSNAARTAQRLPHAAAVALLKRPLTNSSIVISQRQHAQDKNRKMADVEQTFVHILEATGQGIALLGDGEQPSKSQIQTQMIAKKMTRGFGSLQVKLLSSEPTTSEVRSSNIRPQEITCELMGITDHGPDGITLKYDGDYALLMSAGDEDAKKSLEHAIANQFAEYGVEPGDVIIYEIREGSIVIKILCDVLEEIRDLIWRSFKSHKKKTYQQSPQGEQFWQNVEKRSSEKVEYGCTIL